MSTAFNIPHRDTASLNKEFALGAETEFGGIVYRYVQAGAAISTSVNEPYALAIDEAEQALKLTAPLALAGHRIGFAPRAIIPDNAYFWARMQGVFPIRVAADTAADVRLRVAVAGGGRLSSASLTASGAQIMGVVITAAASTSTSADDLNAQTIRTAIAGPLTAIIGGVTLA